MPTYVVKPLTGAVLYFSEDRPRSIIVDGQTVTLPPGNFQLRTSGLRQVEVESDMVVGAGPELLPYGDRRVIIQGSSHEMGLQPEMTRALYCTVQMTGQAQRHTAYDLVRDTFGIYAEWGGRAICDFLRLHGSHITVGGVVNESYYRVTCWWEGIYTPNADDQGGGTAPIHGEGVILVTLEEVAGPKYLLTFVVRMPKPADFWDQAFTAAVRFNADYTVDETYAGDLGAAEAWIMGRRGSWFPW